VNARCDVDAEYRFSAMVDHFNGIFVLSFDFPVKPRTEYGIDDGIRSLDRLHSGCNVVQIKHINFKLLNDLKILFGRAFKI
jgi:hypothetical protein